MGYRLLLGGSLWDSRLDRHGTGTTLNMQWIVLRLLEME